MKHHPTWQEVARLLHSLNPEKFTPVVLAHIFQKNNGTVWWALHPEWRKEFDRDRSSKPEVKARHAAAMRRWRARKKSTHTERSHEMGL